MSSGISEHFFKIEMRKLEIARRGYTRYRNFSAAACLLLIVAALYLSKINDNDTLFTLMAPFSSLFLMISLELKVRDLDKNITEFILNRKAG